MLPKSVVLLGILVCAKTFLLASWLLCQRRKSLYFRGMVLVRMWLGVVIRNDMVLVGCVPKMDVLDPTQGEIKPPELLLLFGGKSFVFWCHGVTDACRKCELLKG